MQPDLRVHAPLPVVSPLFCMACVSTDEAPSLRSFVVHGCVGRVSKLAPERHQHQLPSKRRPACCKLTQRVAKWTGAFPKWHVRRAMGQRLKQQVDCFTKRSIPVCLTGTEFNPSCMQSKRLFACPGWLPIIVTLISFHGGG